MFGNGGLALPVCSFLLIHLPALPLTNHRPVKEVFQWWGEWSSWSSCSRSCGGGVRSHERHCLIQRLPSTLNVNDSYCVGSTKQFQLCLSQPCPTPSVSFKQHQCSQFNSKAFGNRYYQWIPLYPADYISISNKPCDLQCTTIGGERQLLVPAHDGTFCRDTKYHGVCIQGICQPVGCDGELYSTQTIDRCGVCGGNGTSCRRVTGSYRKALTQLGYVFITNIPPGASNIQIIERHQTENILALSDNEGHFFFNGNTIFDNPQNFHVAGTVFKYRRPSSVFSNGLEYIIAQGPTGQALRVMYYNLNGKLPHITYEYTVPLKPQNITAASSVTTGPAHTQVMEELGEEQRRLMNSSRNASIRHHNTLPGADVLLDEDEEVWEVYTPCPSPPPVAVVYRPTDGVGQVLSSNDEQEQEPSSPSAYRQSVHSATRPEDASYLLLENLHHNQTHRPTHTKTLSVKQTPTPKDTSSITETAVQTMAIKETQTDSHSDVKTETRLDIQTETNSELQTETHSDIHTERHLDIQTERHSDVQTERRSDIQVETDSDMFTVTDTHTVILVQMKQVSAAQEANTESNDFDLDSPPGISLDDLYRWKVSAYAPCSSTCTAGITTNYAQCVRYDGAEVDDSYCDSLTRPEPTQEFCSGKECPPRWETSGWSDCSRTCGEGVQYRTVRCWKMLSPGLDSSVYDSLCLSHDLHKPANRKCSARCSSWGFQTREVRCSMETKLCNKSSQPTGSQECEGPPCDRRWTVSDWGPCSGVCGEGRMERAVTCRSSGGLVMSEEQCDQSRRPLAIYPCGDRDCAPHWVEQEWQQCNASCGRGVQQRQVVCAGLEGGVFKEFPDISCDQTSKPETKSSCFQRPCFKWFTTAWSQCSKTCGRGIQVREVKCYQGDELVTRGHSCDSALKPESRQRCEIQSCPTESSEAAAASAATDISCQDKSTANCALVLKVKLCSHWYYQKACCLSCKAQRP
ncbi:ADAMTS-like protein 2 isoform X2 [Melanotaenia boesemani]|uniref:ADAMTS-like protein 2 isoform X2 n=1 Tax=Melanotaenia boesemani TaxID=1250792 RepID=UPI001C05CE4E|nr:ADAMTS-like protein 2 isoform X2 [Melanotaenia boesemani]